MNWTTEDWKLSDLKPNEDNPRFLTKDQHAQLVESLEKYGLVEIPVINKDGTLIAGHQRVQILMDQYKDKDYDALVNVRVPDRQLTKQEADEYLIRSNKNTGSWDFDKLANNFDDKLLLNWGFKENDFFGTNNESEEEEDDYQDGQDDAPDVQEVTITIKGDIYELGEHRAMCGDSTMIDDVEKLMDGKKSDMVFTDPPYGVSYQSNCRTKSVRFDVLENDDIFLTEWLSCLPIVNTGFVFIWTSWKVLRDWIDITKDLGHPSNIIVWDKGGGGIGDLKKTFSTDYELAMVWHNGNKLTGKRIGSVWDCGKDNAAEYKHPTQKPTNLAVTAFHSVTNKNNIVLDLFLGSGSTLIACEKTKRKCYGMEIDPKYCDVIVKRYIEYCKKNNRPYSVKRNGSECKDFDDE